MCWVLTCASCSPTPTPHLRSALSAVYINTPLLQYARSPSVFNDRAIYIYSYNRYGTRLVVDENNIATHAHTTRASCSPLSIVQHAVHPTVGRECQTNCRYPTGRRGILQIATRVCKMSRCGVSCDDIERGFARSLQTRR